MLFSPSPSAQSSSRSSWLDRLRTAKGFSDHDGVTDLDNFLQSSTNFSSSSSSTNNHQIQNRTPIPTPPISQPTHNHNQGTQFFNILHDLFNFGHQSTQFKKSARKQPNPRICNNSSSSNAPPEKAALLRTGDSNSGVEGAKVEIRSQRDDGSERDAGLAGFSRTEVTVIDTSYESWKFEKLLYRKKNVWKVRDKKGKSEILRSKKRRRLEEEEEDPNGGKKWKSSAKEAASPDKQQRPLQPSSEMNKSEVEERGGNRGGDKNQRESKLEDGRTSVILIKSIHNGKKKQRHQPTTS